MFRSIRHKNGNNCLLDCGHTTKSRGKYKAKCNRCTSEGLFLVYSSVYGQYLFKTDTTNCKKCMEKLAAKCNWEHLPRAAILIRYDDILCQKCKKEVGLEKVEYEKI